MEAGAARDAPQWHVVGDWFDVCRCDIRCPCEFAQAPTDNWCEGVLAWHIREGHYGDVRLEGLSVIAIGAFEGNLWAGEGKATMGKFIDEKADDQQREALQMIFGGQAAGFPAEFAEFIGEVRGVEFAPIEVEQRRTGQKRSDGTSSGTASPASISTSSGVARSSTYSIAPSVVTTLRVRGDGLGRRFIVMIVGGMVLLGTSLFGWASPTMEPM